MRQLHLKRGNVSRPIEWFGKLMLKISGWKLEGSLDDLRKAVIIVAHHTSNWDFWHGLMASFVWRMKPFWMGKESLFRPPMGKLLKWLGGIPIDRSGAYNVVEQAARAFQQAEELLLVVTPEGTRKKVTKWKTGFYYIAKEAGVPILCAFIDYKRKVVGLGPLIYPGEDMKADWEKIKAFYQSVTAKYPENVGEIAFTIRNA